MIKFQVQLCENQNFEFGNSKMKLEEEIQR